MRDRTILVSALIACCIHGLILFVSPGMTPPILASAAASIEVTLVAPPAVPAPPAMPAPEPPPVQRQADPEPVPVPPPEPIIEPIAEPVPEPEPAPEPIIEPEPEPAREAAPKQQPAPAEADERLAPATAPGDEPVDSANFTGEAQIAGGPVEGIEPSFDRAPEYLRNPKPSYPRAARRDGQEGKVMLLVEVLPDGRVGEIGVESSSGYELLDNAAIRAVRRWRFVPASKAGRAVRAQVRVPVEFSLKDAR